MDLWIRSQDREDLIKVENIRYWEGNQIAVNVWTSYNNINYVVVGGYKTKERALEVLDEIDSLMSDAVNNGLKVARYEMPEE